MYTKCSIVQVKIKHSLCSFRSKANSHTMLHKTQNYIQCQGQGHYIQILNKALKPLNGNKLPRTLQLIGSGRDTAVAKHKWLFIAMLNTHPVLSIILIPEQLFPPENNLTSHSHIQSFQGANHIAPLTEMRHTVSAPWSQLWLNNCGAATQLRVGPNATQLALGGLLSDRLLISSAQTFWTDDFGIYPMRRLATNIITGSE